MFIFRVQNLETSEKSYAKNRADIRFATKWSDSTISRAIRACLDGKMYAAKGFVIKEVEVDDGSIKELD